MSISSIDITARKAYAGFTLDIAQTIPLGGCTAVFGPSGAGKSTLLRLIAGFLRPDSGRIHVGESIWCDSASGVFVPAYKRPVGTVFQEGRLFPHLTIEKNLLYADRRSDSEGRRFSFGDIVDAFDLQPLLSRRPETLSGGERQRAALARTILTRPKLLLLDEPLSALDRGRKAEILPYLGNLAGRFGAPAIYVSHNVDEILRVADQTVLLKSGRVEAMGDTAAVLNAYGVDADVESGAVVTGKVIEHDKNYRLTRVRFGDGIVSLPINEAKPIGEAVNIRIDARNVAIATRPPDNISIRNVLSAEIASIEKSDGSPFVEIALRVGEAQLKSQITLAACEDLSLAPGQSVHALVKTASFAL